MADLGEADSSDNTLWQGTDSALGAITEGRGAQRPLTYCDSYRLPGMLLLACWLRKLRATGLS
jgi:hypothetical protein